MAPGRSLDFSRRTALYRLYGADDALLYIGIAFNPRTRWYAHASDKSWWHQVVRKEISCWYGTRREAEAAESASIHAEKPRYNIAGAIAPIPVAPKARKVRPQPDPGLMARLRAAGRAHGQARKTREKARARLGDTIRRAASEGIGPAEITRLIGGCLTEKTVSRIIHGHSKA